VQPIPAALLPIELAPQARYFAYLEADSLAVTQKRITRRIDPSLTRAELAGLTWEEVGYIDSVAGPPVHRPPETVPLSLKDVPSRLSGIVSDSWRDGMDILQGYLQSRVGVDRLRILVDEGSEPRGKVVAGILGDTSGVQVVQPIASWRNRRIGRAELPPIERWYELSDSSIQFHLYSLTPSPYRGRWRLTVVDSEDNLVWEKTGDGVIPRYVRWDWRDLRGNVIDSDHYTYFLSWRDQYGQPRESRRYQFFVRRRVYATDVVIQRGLGGVELPDREVQLHLRAPGARVPRHLKED
jgi:hypothetical protein